ncbi:MAG: YEATS-associated helix-containing protein [Bacteroidales bacterium]
MNYYLLFFTILLFGLLGGVVNALRKDKASGEYWKSLVKGVVAAFLVPVFLEIIKSDLGRQLAEDLYDYLVFGGLCLVVAVFSDSFIDRLGERVMEKANRAEKRSAETDQKLNTFLEQLSEPDEGLDDPEQQISAIEHLFSEKPREQIAEVVRSFQKKDYKFRTAEGIAKETQLSLQQVEHILEELAGKNIALKIPTNNRNLWSLKGQNKADRGN